MIGMPNINQYFKVAMGYPVAKLQAVMRGQDKSIPMLAAMAAFEIKGPMEIAAKAQQALAQKSTVNVREKLAQEGEEEKNGMLPDNAMMAMQQQQQSSLPENTGIGQLPAPNMQTMSAANGGIIAFDDGGYVPGYAGSDLFARSDVDEEEIAALRDDQVLPPGRGRGAPPKGGMPEKTRKFLENKDKPKEKTKGRAGVPVKDTNILDELIGAPTRSPNRPNGRAPEVPEAPAFPQSDVDRLVKANRDMQNMPREVAPLPAEEKRKTSTSATNTGIATLGKEPTLEPYKAQSIKDIGADINTTFGVDKLTSGANELGGILEKGATDARARFERRPQQTPYKEYERTLRSEEQNAEQDKKDAFQMALVNAGLGIAAGGSRHALQNIAEGAMVGTKQYMGAMKDLKAAAKERQKAFAMIDEARSAKADKDFDRAEALENSILGHKVKSKELSIDAISKALQITVPQATSVFNKQLEAQEAGRTEVFRQQGANRRNTETVQGHLAGQSMMAAAYKDRAGGANLADKAADNARALHSDWLKSPEGKLSFSKPGSADRKYQEILREQFRLLGIQMPGGGTPAGGRTLPPLMDNPDMFK